MEYQASCAFVLLCRTIIIWQLLLSLQKPHLFFKQSSCNFICFLLSYNMEKVMAPHSSTLARKIPRMEEPGRLQPMGSLRVDTTERLHFHFSLSCIGEGNGNPLQCSCLENPRDGGAWWAAVYGVAQSRTQLKQLSCSSYNIYPSSEEKIGSYRSKISD